MSIDWTAYNARLTVDGTTNRERNINRFKDNINRKIQDSPSCKSVLIDNISSSIVVNSTNKKTIKEISSLPNQIFYSGQIVDYADSKYLIMETDSDKELYVDGLMQECDYLLKWQDESGNIIERWCITKTNAYEGVDGNKTVELGNGIMKITIPYDSETIKIRKDKRFYIDNNKYNPVPYKVTNTSTTSDVRNGHGYLTFVVSEGVTIQGTDRPDLMLCDYISPTTPPIPSASWYMKIDYTNLYIKANGISKTLTAHLYDSNNIEVTNDIVYEWEITSNIQEFVVYTKDKNILTISLSNNYEDSCDEIKVKCWSKYTGQADEITLITKEVF